MLLVGMFKTEVCFAAAKKKRESQGRGILRVSASKVPVTKPSFPSLQVTKFVIVSPCAKHKVPVESY